MLSRAKRKGWTQHIQPANALAKRDDVLATTPVEAAATSMQERAQCQVERMAGISERGVDHIETMNGPEILQSVDRIDKIGRRTFGLEDGNQHQGFSLNLLNLSNLGIEIGTKRIQNPDQPV